MNKYTDLQRKPSQSKIFPAIQSPKPHSLDFQDIFLSPPNYTPTNRISSLTQIENDKIFSSRYLDLNTKALGKSTPGPISTYSSKDFSTLIKNLDNISNKYVQSDHQLLFEGHVATIKLDEGLFHYFQVNCKDKRTPMTVKIRRQKGRLHCFYSKTVERPNNCSYDQSFALDSFEISDYSIKFTHDTIFLSVEALTDVIFSLGVHFGRIKQVYIQPELHIISKNKLVSEIEELRKNDELRMQFKDKVEKIIKDRKKKILKKAGSKNYLKINKNVTGTLSEKLLFNNWDEKKALVLQRKYEKSLEKKMNTIRILQRKEINHECEKKTIEESSRKSKVKAIQKEWITLMYLINYSASIRKLWYNARCNVLLLLQCNNRARIIQKKFKQKYIKLNIKGVILLKCRNNTSFFYETSRRLYRMFSEQIVVSSIASILKNKLIISFKSFNYKVVNIQKASKVFLSKNRSRVTHIIQMWDEMMNKIISRSSVDQIHKYVNISSQTRDTIVNNYYSKKLTIYLNECKPSNSPPKSPPKSPRFSLSINSAHLPPNTSPFLSSTKPAQAAPSKVPIFDFLPSKSILRELIESAVTQA